MKRCRASIGVLGTNVATISWLHCSPVSGYKNMIQWHVFISVPQHYNPYSGNFAWHASSPTWPTTGCNPYSAIRPSKNKNMFLVQVFEKKMKMRGFLFFIFQNGPHLKFLSTNVFSLSHEF